MEGGSRERTASVIGRITDKVVLCGDGHQYQRDSREGRAARPRRAADRGRARGSGTPAAAVRRGRHRQDPAAAGNAAAAGRRVRALGRRRRSPRTSSSRRGCCSTSGTRCRARRTPTWPTAGRALVSDLVGITEPVDDPGDAHRRRRLLVLDAADRLASLADGRARAAGARGPALVRRAEPGGRRAPRPPAALAAAAGGRHPAHRRAAPGRAGPGLAVADAAAAARGGGPAAPPGPGRAPTRMVRELLPASRPSAALVELVHRALGRSAAARRGARERRRAGTPDGRSARTCPRRLAEAIQQRFRMLSSTGSGRARSRRPSYAAASTSSCSRRSPVRRWRMPPAASTSWSTATSCTRSRPGGSASGTR